MFTRHAVDNVSYFFFFCRWLCQEQENTLFNTTTPSGTPGAPQGDQLVLRVTSRTSNRSAALHRYFSLCNFYKNTKGTLTFVVLCLLDSFNALCWFRPFLSFLRWSSSGVFIVTWSGQVTSQATVTSTFSKRVLSRCGRWVHSYHILDLLRYCKITSTLEVGIFRRLTIRLWFRTKRCFALFIEILRI